MWVGHPIERRLRRRFLVMRRLAAMALLGALVSCGDSAGPGLGTEEWANLHAARGRWSDSGISDYAYGYMRSCECLPTDVAAPSIEVRDGAIVRVWDGRTGESVPADRYGWYFTVDDLFAEIARAIADGVYQLQADYHPTLGYPTMLVIDYDARMADEELILRTIGPVLLLD
jgi:hypothetical protein